MVASGGWDRGLKRWVASASLPKLLTCLTAFFVSIALPLSTLDYMKKDVGGTPLYAIVISELHEWTLMEPPPHPSKKQTTHKSVVLL